MSLFLGRNSATRTNLSATLLAAWLLALLMSPPLLSTTPTWAQAPDEDEPVIDESTPIVAPSDDALEDADDLFDEFAEADVGTIAIIFRGSFWLPIHITKANEPKINDVTNTGTGFDVALHWYVSNKVSVFGRGIQSGLEMDEIDGAQFTDLVPAISTSTLYEAKVLEVGLNLYLADPPVKGAGFSPYLHLSGGVVDWTLSQDGRGGNGHTISQQELTATDVTGSLGIGVSYSITDNIRLQADWAWRFMLTEDVSQFNLPNAKWGNTHAWSLSPGVEIAF